MLSNVDKILLHLYSLVRACNVKVSHNTCLREDIQTDCAVKPDRPKIPLSSVELASYIP
jgi:hypothetical protein